MGRGSATEVVDGAYIPRAASGVTAVEVDGEAVLLDEVADRLHLMNPTSALLWACFDGESTLAEICADIAEAYRAPVEVVLADATALTVRLRDEGLLAGAPRRVAAVEATDHAARAAPEPDPRSPVALEEPPNP